MRFLWIGILTGLCICESLAQSRIESEYKIAIPKEKESEVWSFLQAAYGNNESGLLPSDAITSSNTEIFYDTYFDDVDETLLSYKVGARYRERYVNDSLVKTLIQLKVPTQDNLGVARIEHKFRPEQIRDITDRNGLHPFLKYIKSNDLSDVDLILGQFGTSARNLSESIKLKQIRKRVYVSDAKGPLMTFTLDEVSSFYFPYNTFVELELELNEIRYTDASYNEQKKLESMNAKIKQSIFDRFDDLIQDQTPKYNKMHAAVAAQPVAWVYNNLMYLILSGIGIFALALFWKNERKLANT